MGGGRREGGQKGEREKGKERGGSDREATSSAKLRRYTCAHRDMYN